MRFPENGLKLVRSGSTLERILATGVPNLLASAVMFLSPLLGKFWLSAEQYAFWSLASAIFTVSIVFDFGASAYLLRAGSRGTLGAGSLRALVWVGVASALVPGILGVLGWMLLSGSHDFGISRGEGLAYFSVLGIAGAVKSGQTVLLANLVVHRRSKQRALILLGSAVFHVILVFYILVSRETVWALPIAAGVTSGLSLAYLLRDNVASSPPVRSTNPADSQQFIRAFMAHRGVLATLGLALTQLDKWAVGALAGPATLAEYEFASRLAGLPRLVVLGLLGVLVAEAAQVGEDKTRTAVLYRRSLVATMSFVSLGSILTGAAALILFPANMGGSALFVLLAFAYGINACTAPRSLFMTGLGNPQDEYRYLVPAVVSVGLVCVLIEMLNWGQLAVYVTPACLGTFSLLYACRLPPQLQGPGRTNV